MAPFATDFASRSFAPLTFDRTANPDGRTPLIVDGALQLTVQRGTYADAVRGDPDACDRCEVREPDKVPLSIAVRHSFTLRVPAGFPRTSLRFVAAQLKLNGGASPLFALRISDGRLYADWRLPGLTVEHYDRLPACAQAWTRFDLVSSAAGAELFVNGDRISRLRATIGPPNLTRFLKVGPYRDKDPRWSDGPATVEVREVRREALVNVPLRTPGNRVFDLLKRDVAFDLETQE